MSWIEFSVKDLIDILLVTFFLYYTYKALKTSGSRTLFSGIISFVIIWVVISKVLDMRLMGAILDQFVGVGFILLVILFQDDIKRFLNALGSTGRWKFLGRLFNKEEVDEKTEASYIAAVTLACVNLARKKTGGLIVIEGQIDLEPYEHTGEIINADVNARLIENIFFKNSPLHDGALIISNHKLTSAGCILPVAQNVDMPKEMGLRHRSGLGMARLTDAKVVIISEERGKISLAYKGEIIRDVRPDELQTFLSPSVESMETIKALRKE